MSRKYLNDKYCVRCGRKTPTPYLKQNYKCFGKKGKGLVVDLGCGNGRNSEFMKKRGHEVLSLDMVGDYGVEAEIGKQPLPVTRKANIILCNYLMMFLGKKERRQLIQDIKRISASDCTIMVELYPAKDSFAKTKDDMLVLQKEIFDALGWEKIRYSQGRFIAKNVESTL